MTASRSLPDRPSLESIRKQAKKLARDIAAGNPDATARARAQLPEAELPLSQRAAQLVLAREYGFAGWQDLREEVQKRVGGGVEWAAGRAKRAIHDNDVERLKQLLAEYPGLLSWRIESGGILASATSSFGDSFDDFREQHFTRRACAELLIDAGAEVTPSVWEGVISARARGLLQLLWSKGVLPRTLRILAALGDLEGARAGLEESGDELATVNDAFICACRFQHAAVASVLLERCIALDAELGARIDGGRGRAAFIEYLGEHTQELAGLVTDALPITPWRAFVMHEILSAVSKDDLPAFTRLLRGEAWLLGESCVGFQVKVFEQATLQDRAAIIRQLFELDPALLRRRPPPRSSALVFAFEYVRPHLVPLLTRIWPLPDDLPHAAGMGDLARVQKWFDAAGQPALGNLADHYPANSPQHIADWGPPDVQHILDTALGWACLNRHFEIAELLLEHGADINTRWSTHEPASILHELVFHDNYDAMRFLIDRGIDMTIRDYRWNATAAGWASHAAKNETMARFLVEAEHAQKKRS